MNYIKLYNSIINQAKTRAHLNIYYEKHHILPKSLFHSAYARNVLGNFNNIDCIENIVRLTMKEHVVCHKILVKLFKEKDTNCYVKMLYAANFLTSRNSNEVSWLKEQYSIMLSKNMTGKPGRAKNKKWSDEAKKRKSELSPQKGKTYEELYGKERAEEYKKLRSENRLGKKNTFDQNNNIKKSIENRNTEEYRLKQRNAHLGKKMDELVRQKLIQTRNNPDTNPSVNQTLYEFYHKDGRVVVCRRYDIHKLYHCPEPHIIVRDSTKFSGGWKCIRVVLES